MRVTRRETQRPPTLRDYHREKNSNQLNKWRYTIHIKAAPGRYANQNTPTSSRSRKQRLRHFETPPHFIRTKTILKSVGFNI